MNKIGFIGAYDKTDLLINIAKVLVEMEKKVLIIDSTMNQKAKYIVPAINPTTSYVTEYEGIDVAVGFYSFQDIEQYLGISDFEAQEYEYVLIDIDNPNMVQSFNIQSAFKNYFITSFDMYSLKRGIEILSGIRDSINLTKVLFSEQILQEDDDYLNFLSLGKKINWEKEKIYFPINSEDQSIIIENQRISKIKIKTLSSEYKDALTYITEQISNNSSFNIKRIIKQI